MKNFILCADDYGIAPGVSKAILDLAHNQRLSAIGCMTNFKRWPIYAHELAALSGKLDIGLHLNLTLGNPLSDMKHIAPTGEFQKAGSLVKQAIMRQLDSTEIEQEINLQCEAFENALQREPNFIDGHQHVHALPVIRQALVRVINRRYMHKKPWLRNPADTIVNIVRRGVSIQKALTVTALATGLRQLTMQHHIPTNSGFSGFSAFDPTRNYGSDFAKFLIDTGSRHLIMCHPGFIDDELRQLDPVIETRPLEYKFFMSDEFKDTILAQNVCLAQFNLKSR